MNITLGSLVLCKILMLNPAVMPEAPRPDGLSTYNSTSTNMTIMQMSGKKVEKAPDAKSAKTPPVGYSERIVTGVVEEIQSRRKLVEVEKNKKFEYKEFHTLLIKTDNLEKLLIGADACALAETMIKDKDAPVKDLIEPEIAVEVVAEVPPKKKQINKVKPKVEKKAIEESDINLDEYDVVTDESVLSKYSEYIDQHKLEYEQGKNNIKIIDGNTGKVTEVASTEKEKLTDAEYNRIAQEIMNFNEEKNDEAIAEEQKVVVVVEEPKEKPVPVEVVLEKNSESESNLFSFFESKNKKDTEPKVAEKKVEVPVQKKKEVVVEKKKPIPTTIVYNRDTNVIVEAFKMIIFNK